MDKDMFSKDKSYHLILLFFRSNNQNISLLVGGDFNLDVLSLPVLTESSGKPIVALRYKMYAVYLGSTTFLNTFGK